MYKLIAILVLSLSIICSCSQPKSNANDAAEDAVEKVGSDAEVAAKKKRDYPKESDKVAETLINQMVGVVDITSDQKASIMKLANDYNFDNEDQAKDKENFRAFRKKIRDNILTAEQLAIIKARKKK